MTPVIKGFFIKYFLLSKVTYNYHVYTAISGGTSLIIKAIDLVLKKNIISG